MTSECLDVIYQHLQYHPDNLSFTDFVAQYRSVICDSILQLIDTSHLGTVMLPVYCALIKGFIEWEVTVDTMTIVDFFRWVN